MINVADLLKHVSGEGEKTLIFGNGVIASMTSHLVDLTKNVMERCVNCNGTHLISCFVNEYGYEQRTEKVINFCCDVDDLLIVISSSGSFRGYTERCQTALNENFKEGHL